MRNLFTLEIKRKIFFNCFNSYFLGLEQFGVMFFKIELYYDNISKKNLVSRMSLFESILYQMELAHCLAVVLTPNKISAIFGVRPLFVRSSSLIEFMIRSNLADTHEAFLDLKLEYFSNIGKVLDYFKSIVLHPDLIFFDWRLFTRLSYPYEFDYLTSYISECGFYPFSQKKLFNKKTSSKPSIFDKWIPSAHQDTYDERTIIKILAVYCKVRGLVLNDCKELLDIEGCVLGDYRIYLIDNFFDICIFLKEAGFEYNFLPLNVYDLYVQYIEKAERILYKNSSVLFFVKEPLGLVAREKIRLERKRLLEIKANEPKE